MSTEVRNKERNFLVILGGGESGVGTAILGKKEGYRVFVSDKGKITASYKQVLEEQQSEWEEEKHSEEKIFEADLGKKNPEIPEDAQLVGLIRGKGIPVISEIEFASRFTAANLIGITGSNGKTT